ncbi:MAG: flagellar hook-associated protein FlgK [Planctomycetota bacterium]|nr:flagellar hook-associated protein FlgK [Planctomycetota bacterium]
MGLNSALINAGNALNAYTTSIQVAGQNIANANTPGYVRESALLATSSPTRQGDLIVGSGVEVIGIQQQINLFLEKRIHTSNGEFKAAESRNTIYKQLELQLRELGTSDLSSGLNEFLGSINDIVAEPESTALRQFVIQQGQQFASDVTNLRDRINTLRVDTLNLDHSLNVETLVTEANKLLDIVDALNPQIVSMEQAGLSNSDAGGLRSERYQALDRLSEIVPIQFLERENGFVEIRTGSESLIQLGSSTRLETYSTIDRDVGVLNVRIADSKALLPPTGGIINGVAEGRDNVLGKFVDDLNRYTAGIIFEFNKIHASGEGTKRHTSLTGTNPIADQSAALNDSAAGLAFTPEHGRFEVRVTNAESGITETTAIQIDLDGIGTETSAASLLADLDAIAGLNASITSNGRFSITSDPGFEFAFANDSSSVLAALGINTFFTGSNSNDIGVNSLVTSDPGYLATSQGGGPSDNRNAVALSEFADNKMSSLDGQSIVEFYSVVVADVAQGSATEQALTDGLLSFKLSLFSQKQQTSGVSLDEEAINLIEFQHGYQAAARMISTLDELFTILLQL